MTKEQQNKDATSVGLNERQKRANQRSTLMRKEKNECVNEEVCELIERRASRLLYLQMSPFHSTVRDSLHSVDPRSEASGHTSLELVALDAPKDDCMHGEIVEEREYSSAIQSVALRMQGVQGSDGQRHAPWIPGSAHI